MEVKIVKFVKRGRPPSSSLADRVIEGSSSSSQFKCPTCLCVFPRNKSLQAHIRTHTGETPYTCDYPGCISAFRQSGHLRSHIYRHTGEKPFRCPAEGCRERFSHSNRKCSVHPKEKMVRDGLESIDVNISNLSESQQQWLESYEAKKFMRGTKRKRSPTPDLLEDSDEENIPVDDNRLSPAMNKRNDGFNSSGSEPPSSPCSSEINDGDIEVALILVQMKNKGQF